MPASEVGKNPEKMRLSAEIGAYAHGRVPRALRHRQVVAAAVDLFIERGYERAAMDELARRVGVSKPVIYDLVGSKEQLFREVMTAEAAELAQRTVTAVSSEPDPERRLHAGALAFFRYVEERRAYWGSLIVSDAAPVTREMAAARRQQAALAARLLAEGAAETGSRVDSRLMDVCAHAINAALEAMALWWQDHPDLTPEQLADLATRLLQPGLMTLRDARLSGAITAAG